MAENRLVKTRIWQDSWFSALSEQAQRLYLYILTNKNTRICGYYELPMFEIIAHMKWNEEKVLKIMKELTPKIGYVDGWIYISKYPIHQNVANNVKVQAAIERELKDVPDHVLNLKSQFINHKSETIDSLSIDYKNNKKEEVKSKKDVEIYGEFENVKLSTVEWGKLVDSFGEKNTNVLIEQLSAYLEQTGKKYKSHYATLLNWGRRKVEEFRKKQQLSSKPKMI